VGRVQTRNDLEGDRKGDVRRHEILGLQDIRQRFTSQELHGQELERAVTVCAQEKIEKTTDVAVGYSARKLNLTTESLPKLGFLYNLRENRLQSDRLTELEILGLIDRTHSSLAQQTDDAKPAEQEGTGFKPNSVRWTPGRSIGR
jgi:hypothetical protein